MTWRPYDCTPRDSSHGVVSCEDRAHSSLQQKLRPEQGVYVMIDNPVMSETTMSLQSQVPVTTRWLWGLVLNALQRLFCMPLIHQFLLQVSPAENVFCCDAWPWSQEDNMYAGFWFLR